MLNIAFIIYTPRWSSAAQLHISEPRVFSLSFTLCLFAVCSSCSRWILTFQTTWMYLMQKNSTILEIKHKALINVK